LQRELRTVPTPFAIMPAPEKRVSTQRFGAFHLWQLAQVGMFLISLVLFGKNYSRSPDQCIA
jgi:hypothetical protein